MPDTPATLSVYVLDREGRTHALTARVGATLMETIRAAGLPIAAECGGNRLCATCHVYLDPAWLEACGGRTPDEQDLLDLAPDVDDRSRLSRRIVLGPDLDGCTATLAPETH